MADFKELREQAKSAEAQAPKQPENPTSGQSRKPPVEAWSKADAREEKPIAASRASLDLVMDIPVRMSMEVGSAELSVRDLLDLRQGAVVELDRRAGEPLDVLVNGALVARGEVVVVNEQLGIRLTELVSPADRARALGKEEA